MKKATLALAVLAITSAPAFSETQTEELSGFRIAPEFSYLSSDDLKENLVGYGLELGFDFNKNIGTSISYSKASSGNSNVSDKTELLGLSFDYGFTIKTDNNNDIKPYLLLGAEKLSSYGVSNDAIAYGVGVRAVNTDHILISIEHKLLDVRDADSTIGATTLSIGYTF